MSLAHTRHLRSCSCIEEAERSASESRLSQHFQTVCVFIFVLKRRQAFPLCLRYCIYHPPAPRLSLSELCIFLVLPISARFFTPPQKINILQGNRLPVTLEWWRVLITNPSSSAVHSVSIYLRFWWWSSCTNSISPVSATQAGRRRDT